MHPRTNQILGLVLTVPLPLVQMGKEDSTKIATFLSVEKRFIGAFIVTMLTTLSIMYMTLSLKYIPVYALKNKLNCRAGTDSARHIKICQVSQAVSHKLANC